jgi:hypothetical protein
MMSEIGALGDAVTGAVVGRAVEPKAGEGGHTDETSCLNCRTRLTGPFCNQCGQHAHVHRTLSAFFHDFLHGVLHFEGKIWRTLPLLVWKPGDLTRRYVDGQRASFVSPIALFLFTVFLTFAVMGLTGNINPNLEGSKGLAKAEQEAASELSSLQQQRAQAVANKQPTTELDQQISEDRQSLDVLQSLREKGVPPTAYRSGMINSDLPWLADAVHKAEQNPELLFYKLKTNAYKFSWALIPISVPFVWLLFPFSRGFRMYDHIVFVTYSLCFMMLLLVAGTLVETVSPSVAGFAWFVPPVHMYRQLRGAYGVGRFGAVWRTFALTIFAFIAIALFAGLMVTLGALD